MQFLLPSPNPLGDADVCLTSGIHPNISHEKVIKTKVNQLLFVTDYRYLPIQPMVIFNPATISFRGWGYQISLMLARFQPHGLASSSWRRKRP